jgi:hypothetical protein
MRLPRSRQPSPARDAVSVSAPFSFLKNREHSLDRMTLGERVDSPLSHPDRGPSSGRTYEDLR